MENINQFDIYLESTDLIDWRNQDIMKLAVKLAEGSSGKTETAKRIFEWVRDEVKHSMDYKLNPVTCVASDVLKLGTGFCYAKSHLLAALLRANGIPAGFCYQRLAVDEGGASSCIHGLNALWLKDFGWYRVDARGNREDVNAQFSPPVEKLAFEILQNEEANLPEIWPSPLPIVVEALRNYKTYDELANNLPDIEIVNGD